MAGYSGTPLAKKLGIKSGSRIHLRHAPEGYLDLVAPLPEGVALAARLGESVDLVHVFSTRRQELAKDLETCRKKMRPDAMIWVSWPKKTAKVPTDIVEDTIRDVALPLGLVDVKVCAINDVWSGLKLVLRRENRPR
jgi:hypothetical protein